MTKVKKDAESKGRTRERHIIKDIYQYYHEGVNQDNYRICRCGGYHRSAAFGYFFLGGESDIKHVQTKKDIEDNWESCSLNYYGFHTQGLGKMCYAIYDRKRNILVFDEKHSPDYLAITKTVNEDCAIFRVRNITDVNITRKPKQLALAYIDYLLSKYIQNLSDVYRLLGKHSITIYRKKLYDRELISITKEIKAIVDNYKTIPRNKSLGKGDIYIGNNGWRTVTKTIDFPTINDVINFKVFTKKEIKLINQRKWWTKNGFRHNISFKETQTNWNTKVNDVLKGVSLWQDNIAKRNSETLKIWNERIDKLKKEVDINRKAKIDAIFNIPISEQLKRWREQKEYESYDKFKIVYDDFKTKGRIIEWFKHEETVNINCFDNKQLKLSEDRKVVITSSNARVNLIHAITLFNKLYNDYILPILNDWINNCHYDYCIDFRCKHIYIGCYELRRIGFKDKVTDYPHKPLGYKEWFVEIGCHVLWFDDVKEFCRYYHLEDKVDFSCD